jgi:hypothetical protein
MHSASSTPRGLWRDCDHLQERHLAALSCRAPINCCTHTSEFVPSMRHVCLIRPMEVCHPMRAVLPVLARRLRTSDRSTMELVSACQSTSLGTPHLQCTCKATEVPSSGLANCYDCACAIHLLGWQDRYTSTTIHAMMMVVPVVLVQWPA